MTRFSFPAVTAAILAVSMMAASPVRADEPLRWTFYPGDGAGAAVLSNCSECDYAEVTVSCEQGTGEMQIAVAIDVPGAHADETRELTFMFGEAGVPASATLYANELEGTIEPIAIVPPDHPVLKELATYIAVPDIAVSDEEKKRIAENSSFEVIVENGPAKTFPLRGAQAAMWELQAFCSE